MIQNGGFGKATVAEVEHYFAEKCALADTILKQPAGCRFFLNWHDETPREEMRLALIPEVKAELDRRKE